MADAGTDGERTKREEMMERGREGGMGEREEEEREQERGRESERGGGRKREREGENRETQSSTLCRRSHRIKQASSMVSAARLAVKSRKMLSPTAMINRSFRKSAAHTLGCTSSLRLFVNACTRARLYACNHVSTHAYAKLRALLCRPTSNHLVSALFARALEGPCVTVHVHVRCMCTRACACWRERARTRTCARTCVHASASAWVRVYVYLSVRARVRARACLCVRVRVCVRVGTWLSRG
mmetsp:Transcript_56359/g.122706  ORF Transcript_56359/g.122706 Transcript_56359/m.122706 type:complete len:241 (+) Transcript_56359:453-1175(+)